MSKRPQARLSRDIGLRYWRNRHMRFLTDAENKEKFFRRIATIFPESDERYKAIERAYETAKTAFRGVPRDGGERYFEHLRAVALIILDYFEIRDHEVIIAALLHDIVEDKKDWSVQKVRDQFGNRVAYLVDYMSKPDGFDTKEEAEAAYHLRFEQAPRIFFFLKLSDRLHNLLTLGARPRQKQIAKIAETERYYLPYARLYFILLPEMKEILRILHLDD